MCGTGRSHPCPSSMPRSASSRLERNCLRVLLTGIEPGLLKLDHSATCFFPSNIPTVTTFNYPMTFLFSLSRVSPSSAFHLAILVSLPLHVPMLEPLLLPQEHLWHAQPLQTCGVPQPPRLHNGFSITGNVRFGLPLFLPFFGAFANQSTSSSIQISSVSASNTK